MLNKVKNIVKFIRDTFLLIWGIFLHIAFQKQSQKSYLAMIRLFCFTKGYSNDLVSNVISVFNKPYDIDIQNSNLGKYTLSDVENVVDHLKRSGYYVFEQKLSPQVCQILFNKALTEKCLIHPGDGECHLKMEQTEYNPQQPQATKLSFALNDLINWPEIQDLIADPVFIAISQSYMKSKVYFDQSMLWWSTAYKQKPDSEAAQMYHFDMDRFKWLKFFVYLTDVDHSSGPHTYVSGTHKSGAIPRGLLDKGYSRLTDSAVSSYFSKDRIIEHKGKVGTILVEDTRGLHKGKSVSQGHRLILEIQYSNSLWGADLQDGRFVKHSAMLAHKIQQCPKVFKHFVQ